MSEGDAVTRDDTFVRARYRGEQVTIISILATPSTVTQHPHVTVVYVAETGELCSVTNQLQDFQTTQFRRRRTTHGQRPYSDEG